MNPDNFHYYTAGGYRQGKTAGSIRQADPFSTEARAIPGSYIDAEWRLVE